MIYQAGLQYPNSHNCRPHQTDKETGRIWRDTSQLCHLGASQWPNAHTFTQYPEMLWLWDTVSREYTPFPSHKHPERTVATLTPSVNAKCLSHTNTHAKDMNVKTPPAYYCASKNNHSLRITGRELKGGIRICEHDCKETREVPLSGSTWGKNVYRIKM